MSIWNKPAELAAINAMNKQHAVGLLGIEFTEIGADFLVARMPVEARTQQPFGLLHGGVSCVMAETMGGVGGWLASPEGMDAVGTDINASHLRGVQSGWVTGIARPLRVGRRVQFWGIEMSDEQDRLVCTARLTVAIVTASQPGR